MLTRVFAFFTIISLISRPAACRGGQSMVNGVESEQMPFMVSIRHWRMDDPFGSGHICGGSILTPNLILTTASCAQITDDITVIAGSNMRFNRTNVVEVRARVTFIHPEFNSTDRSNNIALIETNTMPTHFENIGVINLSSITASPGDHCHIYGFGQSMSLTAPRQMQVGDVQVVDNSACHDHRGNLICAGLNTYPCNGDEGGPVVCDNQIAGMIDFFDFNHCRIPVLIRHTSYIDVAPYREWIVFHMRRIELETEETEEATTLAAEKIAIGIFSLIFNIFIVLVLL